MIIIPNPRADQDRREAFSDYARRKAQGEVLVPPYLLPPHERRVYVRQTLREDHQFRIRNRPEGAQAKFDMLASGPFVFFRGTALLYYRDMAGTDGHLPAVLTVGDVHPENFGVMPNRDGAPFFGINDFDEAYVAPFSWDLKRGGTGFFLVARANGLKKKHARAVVEAFVDGYLDALRAYLQDDRERWHEYRIDNSPDMIRNLLEQAQQSRKRFLKERVDLEKGRFRATEEIVPRTSDVEQFQKVIDGYQKENDIPENTQAGHFEVKDVAVKTASGTASLGLDRYWVLIDGPSDDNTDDLILEVKQSRPSALHGLVPDNKPTAEGEAHRIVQAQTVHLAGGDPYYGFVTIDDRSFLVRERSPYKDDIDVGDLDQEGLVTYARICGQTLAQAHARADEDTGIMDGNAEENILTSIHPNVFRDDIVQFAQASAKHVEADFDHFRRDHELGAFRFVHE